LVYFAAYKKHIGLYPAPRGNEKFKKELSAYEGGKGEAWDAYIWVENADALNRELKSKGVKIARDICDQPYGCRDFDVEDCNGYRLCFGQDIEK
jgi:predicted enzyme related to lactoylglutathione lyase